MCPRYVVVAAVLCNSFATTITAAEMQYDGFVYLLGTSLDGGRHLWRFRLDGTYLDDVAPDNSFAAVVLPGDGFLYGVRYNGDLTRMNPDGTGAIFIDMAPDPADRMGGSVRRVHPDGMGGILMSPAGYGYEARTLVRYSLSGELL